MHYQQVPIVNINHLLNRSKFIISIKVLSFQRKGDSITMALSAEFVNLVEQEIPEGRQSLSDSHANLEKVAAYCIENFARVRMFPLINHHFE